jgi:predicted Zn-dependent protease
LSPDSSGWASAGSHRYQDIDGHAAGERAAQKAIAGRNPQPIEAKPYTVILEPAALSEILSFLAWSLDAKAADEGRSAFAGKAGQQIGVPEIDLSSIPNHPQCPVAPFGADGMPSPTVQWIEGGVLRNLAHSRYWAQKMNRPYTGFPTNLIMSGSEASLEDMVASTEYGLLVTRFWYIRYVDPMKLLLTGMTRDGLFLIRDGRIASGVKNLRFNESPLRMLPRVRQLGVPQVVTVHGPAYLPAMKVDEFTFSSATAF